MHYVVTEYGIAYPFGKSSENGHGADRSGASELPRGAGGGQRLGYVGLSSTWPRKPHIRARGRTIQPKNGATVPIRPARASDAGAAGAVSPSHADQVYTRFFRWARLPPAELQTLCNVNHETEVAFLAVTRRAKARWSGSACYFLNSTTNLAEIASW